MSDAGWAPHFMFRMDTLYKRHHKWIGKVAMAPGAEGKEYDSLGRLPSDYFKENIYVTFQDDWVAFKMTGMMNVERLMWANDFPHSDATWPWSQQMLAEHTKTLSEHEKRRILHDNVAELYGLEL